jgi:hypothetical protein
VQELVQQECQRWAKKGVNIKLEHRQNRRGYKAGALKEGMKHGYVRDCDFVAIFDADFQPGPDFLCRAIPFLIHNPDIALIQARWKFGKYVTMFFYEYPTDLFINLNKSTTKYKNYKNYNKCLKHPISSMPNFTFFDKKVFYYLKFKLHTQPLYRKDAHGRFNIYSANTTKVKKSLIHEIKHKIVSNPKAVEIQF